MRNKPILSLNWIILVVLAVTLVFGGMTPSPIVFKPTVPTTDEEGEGETTPCGAYCNKSRENARGDTVHVVVDAIGRRRTTIRESVPREGDRGI